MGRVAACVACLAFTAGVCSKTIYIPVTAVGSSFFVVVLSFQLLIFLQMLALPLVLLLMLL